MADFINTIDLLGDEVVASMIIEKTITEFNDDTITSLGYGVFKDNNVLESVNLPKVIVVPSSSFSAGYPKYYQLKSANFQGAETLSSTAFSRSRIENIVLPSALDIQLACFESCPSLESVEIPRVTNIASRAFGSCSKLVSVKLPAVPPTLANVDAFQYINANCVFYYPAGSFDAYASATNWSELMDYDWEEY